MARPRLVRAAPWLAAPLAAAVLAACGDGDAAMSAADESEDAPGALVENRSHADVIVGQGQDAFDERLEGLRGYPVVVNQWAAWCASCRSEFPFFRRATALYKEDVVFLGLDSRDNLRNAEAFLSELPVGFPSIFDPEGSVAAGLGGGESWPTTIYLDGSGDVVDVNEGAYASEELLFEDIERYALGEAPG